MSFKRIALILVLLTAPGLCLAQSPCTESYGSGPNGFSLATGSPGELGLLKALGDAFAKKEKTTLCWVKAGTGESMQLLKDKKVDMIMVHAPAAEKKAVADGWAIKRELIGSNEFYIVGPPNDPAGIKNAKTAAEAYALIAKQPGQVFLPRRQLRHAQKGNGCLGEGRHQAFRRLVRGDQGFHAGHPQAGRRRKGLLHDRQQHLGERPQGDQRA